MVHAKLPATRISYISIKPSPSRWALVERMKKANQMIKDYSATDKSLAHIDVFTPMLGADGRPRPELFRDDKLHLNETGYKLRQSIIEPCLKNQWGSRAAGYPRRSAYRDNIMGRKPALFSPRPRCGLCGKTRALTKTECCDQWICDDEHKYVLFSYDRNSCHRNHRRYTLCGYHHAEGHAGSWKKCSLCRRSVETEMRVWYGTNEHNFEKLDASPSYEPT